MNQIQITNRAQIQTFRNNMIDYRDANDLQNIRNKTTVKKQMFHPFIRFNQFHGKENKFNHSNVMQFFLQKRHNLAGKDTVRKQNETYQENEAEFCTNHPERRAEFMVKIEEQMLTYCKKCATQVASQGFDVHKIVTSPIHNLTQPFRSSSNTSLNISTEIFLPSISPSRRRQSLTNKNERILNEKLSELMKLANSLKDLKSKYHQKSEQLSEICQTFESEKQTLTNYYSKLISYIEEIRDSHIQAIEQSSVNVIQVCEIENGEISQTVSQIQEMVDDIEGNMQMILDQVDQHSYIECYQFYKQKQGIFSHRLEELGSEAKPWPCTSQEQVLNKIHNFKSFVNELHEVHDQEESFEHHQAESFIY